MSADAIEDVYALSPLQTGMLFHTLYSSGRGVYMDQVVYALEGNLNVRALELAWQHLIERHQVLRTSFHWEEVEEPLQVVHTGAEAHFEHLDWQDLPDEEQHTRLDGLLKEERARGVELTQAPLMRFSLIRANTHVWRLVWTFHHLLLDRWSVNQVLTELMVVYDALSGGRKIELPHVRPYGDYIGWLQEQDIERAETYWRRTLAGRAAPTTLPMDRAPGSAPGHDLPLRHELYLSEETSSALRALGRQHRLTLSTLVQGAWALLLSRYSGEDDVLFGATVSGRPADLEGVESMVGLFINSLPVRVQVPGQERLVPWLQGLQEQMAQLREHEYSSLTQIQGWSEVPRGVPLFESLVVVQNTPADRAGREAHSGIKLEAAGGDSAVNFPLLLLAVPGQQLRLTFTYDESRYAAEDIERMMGHLSTILESLAYDTAQKVSRLPILTNPERQQLLHEWNDTAAAYPRERCIHELFEEQVERTPLATAVEFDGQSLTYAELNVRANQLAHYLVKQGVEPETLVGLCVERSLHMLIGILGILKAGGAYVPLDPTYPPDRLAFMLEDTRTPLLLTQERLQERFENLNAHVIRLDDEESFLSESSENPTIAVEPESIAYVIYTSGSTGRPKGVQICHRSALNLRSGLKRAVHHLRDPRPLRATLNASLSFDSSVKQLLLLLDGHCLCIVPEDVRSDGDEFVRFIAANRIQFLDCTPGHMQFLATAGLLADGGIRPHVVLMGGDAISASLASDLARCADMTVYNVYGPTECTVDTTTARLDGAEQPVTIGRPLANTRTFILDANGQPVPVGVPGELYIGGEGLARGYLKRPDLTAEHFVPDPFSGECGARLYRTGDLVRYLSNGDIEFLGRGDHQVKIRGYRIELGEIATALQQHPGVQEAAVLALDDGSGDKRLIAYVAPRANRSHTIAGRPRHRLPNNLAVAHLNRNETDYLYQEMFERRAYFKHGITIQDGDCIFDVGSNIGLFTLFAHLSRKNLKFYAFDPNPFVIEVYRLNTLLYSIDSQPFQCGISSENREASFTFYPKFSFLSGLYADVADDQEVVRSFIRRQQKEGKAGAASLEQETLELLDELLEDRFQSETIPVQLRPLSDVIRENRIERIDLLKVNVEKSEYEVLAGIAEQDWTKIRQIAMEVHDINGRLDQVVALLQTHGYHVEIEQDWSLEETTHTNYYIYARSASAEQCVDTACEQGPLEPVFTTDEPLLSMSELREHLRQTLPEYMVPSAFVFLEALPLTPNGKLDRKALPAPDAARPALDAAFQAPTTPAETILAGIWTQVLRLEQVGIHDNFFELGGDSILSIQIIARANQAGLRLTPRQVFQHQTIASLAAVAGTGVVAQAQQGRVHGPAPLTPIQHWFFARDLPQPHHYNQSHLLRVSPKLDPGLLARAVAVLVDHHDALRLRFVPTPEGWQQRLAPTQETDAFACIDLSHLAPEAQQTALAAAAAQMQTSLDLQNGPLLRVVYFDLGAEQPGRLLLVIHHLAVDGVSWRVLLADLEAAVLALLRGEAPVLAAKTSSFAQWARRLHEHAGSEALLRELDYWRAGAGAPVSGLPVDHDGGANTLGSQAVVRVELSAAETAALLSEVPSAYHTQINDVLLCALAQAVCGWTGSRSLLVDLEGHGREPLFDEIDLSRTVGWFTSLFPVRLCVPEGAGVGEALKSVKEQLRGLPHHGIGYGLLRYLHPDAEVRACLAALPQPQISFNYLGQFDQMLDESHLFAVAPEGAGPEVSDAGSRTHLLGVLSQIVDGRLRIAMSYSTQLFETDTVNRLAERYVGALRTLIAHCRSAEAGGFTPSDFPNARISQKTLDLLPRSTSDIYRLSPLQSGMLFHTLYATKPGVYLDQVVYTIDASLDTDAFEQAWQHLVQRHPVLRTSFHWQQVEEPLQVVHQRAEAPIAYLDWRHLSEAEQQTAQQDLLDQDRARGVDLEQAPLIRLTLIRTGVDRWRFLWTFHHLLMDRWSVNQVLTELTDSYEALRAGRRIQFPRVRPYADYIGWLQQQDIPAAEAYWRSTLAGLQKPTSLPTDRSPMGQPGRDLPGRQQLFLSERSSAALQSLARRHRLTLSTLVQGAWALLLSRYSGEDDVLFGATVSGRPADLEGVESMVGLFINSLPVRVQVPGQERLVPWLQGLQEQMAQLREHEYSSLTQIQGWSEVPRGVPLFESLVVVQNTPGEATLEESLLKLRMEGGQSSVDFPLLLSAVPGRQMLLTLSYDVDRYDAVDIARTMGHLQTLLEAFTEDADQKVSRLPLLTPSERHQVLEEWNATAVAYPRERCIHELFEEQVARTPEAVAVVFENQSLTYRELNARANQLARSLVAEGVGPETLVGVCLERSLEMLIGLLGILKAGGAYVPLDPTYPAERLTFMLQDCQAPIVIARGAARANLREYGGRLLQTDLEATAIDRMSAANLGRRGAPATAAYVIYTSGSTSRPKGVVVTQGNLVHSTLARRRLYAHPPKKFLLLSSFAFDSSVAGIFWTLCEGGCLVLPHRPIQEDLPGIRDQIVAQEITHYLCIPSLHQILVDAFGTCSPDALQTVIVAGESCTARVVRAHQDQLPWVSLYNEYGPTETTVWATACEVGPREAGEVVPIGRAIANARTYLLDPTGQPVPVGVSGELYIGGAGLGRGYLNRADLTAEKFVPDPFSGEAGARLYRTGDLCRYLWDGNLEFVGRVDHQVKVRGFRIELGEIESVLGSHPQVREAVVLAREDAPGDRRLAAYVVGSAEPPTATELREHLRQTLPEYMVPSAFVFLEALPLTPNGKVDRKALPEPKGREWQQAYVAPRTPIEEGLAEIFAELLSVESVGIADNFFELGGHSLLATQVISRLRSTFQVELPLRALFEAPTVAGLVQRITIDDAGRATSAIPLMRTSLEGPLPLSFAQQRLWFAHQLAPRNPAYNIACPLRIQGPLAVPALQRAIETLVDRHAVLRTTYVDQEGVPAQVVSSAVTVPFTLVDLGGGDETSQEAEALRLAREEIQVPFDLRHGPLLRCVLYRLADADHLLVLTLHHIAADGWSVGVMIREIVAFYETVVENTPSVLPELPIQYADYAVWQRQQQETEVMQEHLSYWRRQLEGAPQMAKLPFDRPRPRTQSLRGGAVTVEMGRDVTEGLRGLCRQESTTLFMALFTCFNALLYCLGGGEDIVVGTDIAGRDRAELEGLIGFFINNLVLRTDLSGSPSFRQLLARVRDVALEAYTHQVVPFDRLVDLLQPVRDPAYHPLFQLLFVLQNAPAPVMEYGALSLRLEGIGTETSKFDLALFCREMGQGPDKRLRAYWVYNTDLFDAVTIRQMAEQFNTVVSLVVTRPEISLSDIQREVSAADLTRRRVEQQRRDAANYSRFKDVKPRPQSVSTSPTEDLH